MVHPIAIQEDTLYRCGTILPGIGGENILVITKSIDLVRKLICGALCLVFGSDSLIVHVQASGEELFSQSCLCHKLRIRSNM